MYCCTLKKRAREEERESKDARAKDKQSKAINEVVLQKTMCKDFMKGMVRFAALNRGIWFCAMSVDRMVFTVLQHEERVQGRQSFWAQALEEDQVCFERPDARSSLLMVKRIMTLLGSSFPREELINVCVSAHYISLYRDEYVIKISCYI